MTEMKPLKSLAGSPRVPPAHLSVLVLPAQVPSRARSASAAALQWQRCNLVDSLSPWFLSQKQVAVGKGTKRAFVNCSDRRANVSLLWGHHGRMMSSAQASTAEKVEELSIAYFGLSSCLWTWGF